MTEIPSLTIPVITAFFAAKKPRWSILSVLLPLRALCDLIRTPFLIP